MTIPSLSFQVNYSSQNHHHQHHRQHFLKTGNASKQLLYSQKYTTTSLSYTLNQILEREREKETSENYYIFVTLLLVLLHTNMVPKIERLLFKFRT